VPKPVVHSHRDDGDHAERRLEIFGELHRRINLDLSGGRCEDA
jgi:hypothetical protein